MYGDRLSVGMHVVTVEPGPLRNLALGVDRAHVKIDRVAVSPLASALATLTEDEADLGVVCIDMGAGCTTLALFLDGMFVHADAVALGGRHVTLDLARAMSTPLAEAERIKTLHGSVLADAHDDGTVLEVPLVGDVAGEETSRVPRSAINRVIRPRVEETFELLGERLNQTGFAGRGERHIVLTGGASQLTGVDEAAARILGGHVRLAAPCRLQGASQAAAAPGFATAAGLLTYAQAADLEPRSAISQRSLNAGNGYFARMGRWLKESF
jgi:cell division protein FtsA